MNGLQVKDLTVQRDRIDIVQSVSLSVAPGQVSAILGANGAGKTTLLEAISGVLRPAAGTVHVSGQDITTVSRERRAKMGLAHVEQGRTVFPELTVEENLRVSAGRAGVSRVLELFPALQKRLGVPAGHLSGGEQQMLVLGRAIARDPAVLLIDEMSLGLAPVIVKELAPVVRTLAGMGMAVLMVEQFVPLALSLADDVHVLSQGRFVMSGPALDVQAQPEMLREAYLG